METKIMVLCKGSGRTVAVNRYRAGDGAWAAIVPGYFWRIYECQRLGCSFRLLVKRRYTTYGLPLLFEIVEFSSVSLTLPGEPLIECLSWRDVEYTIRTWVARYTKQSMELVEVVS